MWLTNAMVDISSGSDPFTSDSARRSRGKNVRRKSVRKRPLRR